MRLIDQISTLNPCAEAVTWLGDKTLAEAWATSTRGDWMLWLYRRSKQYEKRHLVKAFGRMPDDMREAITSKVKETEYAAAVAELEAATANLRTRATTAVNQKTPASYLAAYDATTRYREAFERARDMKEIDDRNKAWLAANANKLSIAADLCREHLPTPTL